MTREVQAGAERRAIVPAAPQTRKNSSSSRVAARSPTWRRIRQIGYRPVAHTGVRVLPQDLECDVEMRFRVSFMGRARADSVCIFQSLYDSVQWSRFHIGVRLHISVQRIAAL